MFIFLRYLSLSLGCFFGFLTMASANMTIYTSENKLTEGLPTEIKHFWQTGTFDSFQGVNHIRINYASFVDSGKRGHKKCLVIVSGRSEGYLKYQELAYEFFQQGFDVFMLDHRGQGISERMLADRFKGYVESFDFYSDDLHQFIETIVSPSCTFSTEKTIYLLAHSMGGAISARYLQRYPNNIKAAVLSSPMIAVNSGGLPMWLARSIIASGQWLNNMVGNTAWYFVGQGGGYQATPFKDNVLMQSEPRYKIFLDTYQAHPDLQLGGVTFQWLEEALQVHDDLFKDISLLQTPILVLQSGADTVVDNQAQNEFCELLHQVNSNACPNAAPFVIEGARHEVLFEKDSYRNKAIDEIVKWFNVF